MKKNIFIFLGLIFGGLAAQAQQDSSKVEARAYFKDGKLHFQTRNEAFHLWFDNRVYIDAAYYSPQDDISQLQSKANKDLEQDDGKFRFSNGVVLRRARFAVKTELYHKWFGELDVDFAYNEVEVEDMFVGYRFNDNYSIKIGNFKEPMSIERVTSSKNLTGMERPMAVQMFAGGRRLGIAATGWGNHWWASAGLFGEEVSIFHKEKNRGSNGWGTTARVAASPVANEHTTLHIGVAGSYRTPNGLGLENRFVEFRALPESYVDHRRFVRYEIPNVNHYTVGSAELAFRHEKLLVYGEYFITNLSRYKLNGTEHIALKNALFDGWYATASYMILGKNRVYDPSDAEFTNAAVRPKTGNLEVEVRVSSVNLNDFQDASAVITGGQAIAYSAGVNWYPNRNVLVGLNYVYMNNDKYADDKGHVSYQGKALSQEYTSGIDFSVLQARILLSF
ncbi:MAG: OprO/OprP family phosphate-selective porin [Prevotellaceae bacterium]|jgi:phosphate-selective porin|nr:OprO/OprP family phosphate-selective porin [Prevotellaceae bacterium]